MIRDRTHLPVALIVDDDDGIRDSLAELLRDERYVVATAEDGQQALDLMHSGLRPSIVLLDLWMPHVDGNEALLAMKNDPRLAGIPVIVITADNSAKPEHAKAVLRKPIDMNRLLETVNESVAG